MNNPVFKRDIFDDVIRSIGRGVCVIHGARQVGKTTLLYAIINHLKEVEHVQEKQIIFLDLEDDEYLDLCESGYKQVLSYLTASGVDAGKQIYLFIDEIQYLSNPSSFIKLLYDRSSINLIVSGSSSFAIKSKFKDSLVGRTINFELFGLSFSEFLTFKEESILPEKIGTQTPLIIHQKLATLFKEYIIFGGYPKVVLEKEIAYKKKIIQQIIDTYVRKDIAELARIKDIRKFNNFIKILASQSGSLLNIQELSKTLGLSRETIEKYIFILVNTYIIRLVYPYSKNVKVELSKMPKLYFEDTGLLNILSSYNFPAKISGSLFENGIYTILRKKFENINYWRTKHGQEVDFIIHSEDRIIPLEVKLNSAARVTSLISFLERYNISTGLLMFLEGQKIKSTEKVKYVFPWELKFDKPV